MGHADSIKPEPRETPAAWAGLAEAEVIERLRAWQSGGVVSRIGVVVRHHELGYRAIINGLQGGFPVCERPYAEVAARLGTTEAALLDLMEAEGVDRFYLSHLNYAGRGNKNRGDDAVHRMTRDPLMAGLKQHPRPVTGRCGGCRWLAICNGNTRVRAHQLTGDYWAEDPGCYLTDAEVAPEQADWRMQEE